MLASKITQYAIGVMFKQLAKNAFAKCVTPGCAQKIVSAFSILLKEDALSNPSSLLKDILTNPVELTASIIVDAAGDYLERNLTDYLISDGTLSSWDAIRLGTVVYTARVAGHTAVYEFLGRKPIPPQFALLEAEFKVGFDYAKQDIVDILYVAKLTYDTALENNITTTSLAILQTRMNFKKDADAQYAAWLDTDHSSNLVAALANGAAAAKQAILTQANSLPSSQRVAQINISNSWIDKVVAAENLQIQAVLDSNKPPIAKLSVSSNSVRVGQVVDFDSSASADTDGRIVTYSYNFGDSSLLTTPSNAPTSHRYLVAGSYTSTLTVTDNLGSKSTASLPITVQALPFGTSLLPDTGVTAAQCYPLGSNTFVSCTSAAALALNDSQDGMIGRDVQINSNVDGRLGFSFSQVPKAGGGVYSKAECIRDNITGLIWEGKDISGLRLVEVAFTNFGDGRVGDTSAYVLAVNNQGLCGFKDWRLPSITELHGIMDYGVFPVPMLDPIWFVNSNNAYGYWSSTKLTGAPANDISFWYADFYTGELRYERPSPSIYHVRLVR